MLKLVPPLEVVLGSARMDLEKSVREVFSQGCRASPFLVCVSLFNTLRRLYIHSNTGRGRVLTDLRDRELIATAGQQQ